MHSFHDKTRLFRTRRSGLSFLEFLGCFIALVGGIVAGSMYLGIDLKPMVADVLRTSRIVDPGVLGLEPPAPHGQSVDQVSQSQTVSDAVDGDQVMPQSQQLADNPAEPSTTEKNSEKNDSPPLVDPQEVLTAEQQLAATREYWQQLRDTLKEEKKNRTSGLTDTQNWQLFDYLTHRKKGHEKVVEKLEQLNQQGVDPRVLEHGGEVLTWNRSGVNLFQRALSLITDGPSSELLGPFAQSWQSSATQHRMEERLILEKHNVVAGYLEHVFSDGASQQD